MKPPVCLRLIHRKLENQNDYDEYTKQIGGTIFKANNENIIILMFQCLARSDRMNECAVIVYCCLRVNLRACRNAHTHTQCTIIIGALASVPIAI